jgi:hypothetical protein
MATIDLIDAGSNYVHQWPHEEFTYPSWVKYSVTSTDGPHEVLLAFAQLATYGRTRRHIIAFVDGYPTAQFTGTDDFDATGDVVSEIRIQKPDGMSICRYPEDAVPIPYQPFNIVGLPIRIAQKGVHNAWAVQCNVSDHLHMIQVAMLRRLEKASQ